ncbi:hypothetical protein GP475_04360 [Corynebacterium poyangense]|uniref:Uncharacterized protein n=1 Tax=Corynebacterium poyangense TaxID=2684405 RepID=A0A7H0SN36_9CORY|nr:DUF6542 domain-containing protein [Corynebacterium poyangense]MBZ8176976.1 hypothetical protein [Corynebacterium poyangense]QNQ89961.1 hypothetical protein GP475_04360 [Corynebacterium poyangense]
MSHVQQNPPRQRAGSRPNRSGGSSPARSSGATWTGLPLWAGPTIIFAALITGLLFSLVSGEMGTAYLVCFGLSTIVVSLLIIPRGLYLTVVSAPIIFGFFTPVAAWLVTSQLSGHWLKMSRTTLITIIFPLMQFFVPLILITLIAVIVAVVRLKLLQKNNRHREQKARISRQRTAEAERRNQETVRLARQRTSAREESPNRKIQRHQESQPHLRRSDNRRTRSRQITVDELVRRSSRPRTPGSASEDIYTRRKPGAESTERSQRRYRRPEERRNSPTSADNNRDRYLGYGSEYHGFRERRDRRYYPRDNRDHWESNIRRDDRDRDLRR